IAFSKKLDSEGATDVIRRITEDSKFRVADSDRRFAMLFGALDASGPRRELRVNEWKGSRGERIATIEFRSDRTTVTVDEKISPQFGAF
ncbi:hypothetical protein ABTM56_20395, partial [Acinetobacter baumannii]